ISYFMKRYQRIMLCCFLMIGAINAYGQCPQSAAIPVVEESFETGLPAGWKAPLTSDGGNWQVNNQDIGFYTNPGSEGWIYVNDEASDNIGEAVLTSPSFQVANATAGLSLEFDLNFQLYAQEGNLKVEIWDGQEWVLGLWVQEDFKGHVSLEISPLANDNLKVRFTYDDGGVWNWGMGIDNFALYVAPQQCENAICERGETPASCSEDCKIPAIHWVDQGKDLEENAVTYHPFNRGEACDDCSEKVALKFPFEFFGKTYTSVFINSNGNLTFEGSFVTYTPEAFCLNGPKMIAPFFADTDLACGGQISYYVAPSYLVVQYKKVAYYGCGKECDQRNTFQVILTDNTIREVQGISLPEGANVVFSYQDMEWSTGNSSQGQQGFGGAAATVGLNQGDGSTCNDYGTFDDPGYHYYGNSQDDKCPPNGVAHLSHRTLLFNGSTGEVVTPAPVLPPVPDLSFSGANRDSLHILRWPLFTELGTTDFFVVERGPSENELVEWKRLSPTDLFTQDGTAELCDSIPLLGLNYYRLLQFFEDGTFRESPLVELENRSAPQAFSMLRVAPNPFQDYVKISFLSQYPSPAQYIMTDGSGRIFRRGTTQAHQGENMVELSLGDLSPGLYFLSVFNDEIRLHRNLVKL
ncbi:MAG: nidogen-like domain-containing protein, partial [Bacteroidota bacterium]